MAARVKIIELDKENTVDFVLFERFLSFIVSIRHPRLKQRGLLYWEAISPLLNHLAATNIGTMLSKNLNTETITLDRFRYFCEQFNRTFESLSVEQKDHYKNINQSFLDWKSRLEGEDNATSASGNYRLEDSEYEEPEYYKKVLIMNDSFRYSTYLREMYIDHQKYNSENKIDKEGIKRLLKHMQSGGLDIYTRNGENLRKETIYFKEILHADSDTLRGCIHCVEEEMSHNLVHYYIREELLVIGIVYKRENNIQISGYVFPVSKMFYFLNFDKFYYGHKFVFFESGKLEISLAVTNYRNRKIKSRYEIYNGIPEIKPKEFDLTDENLSFKVRAYLKETERDYPQKRLDSKNIQKSTAYFLREVYSYYSCYIGK